MAKKIVHIAGTGHSVVALTDDGHLWELNQDPFGHRTGKPGTWWTKIPEVPDEYEGRTVEEGPYKGKYLYVNGRPIPGGTHEIDLVQLGYALAALSVTRGEASRHL